MLMSTFWIRYPNKSLLFRVVDTDELLPGLAVWTSVVALSSATTALP